MTINKLSVMVFALILTLASSVKGGTVNTEQEVRVLLASLSSGSNSQQSFPKSNDENIYQIAGTCFKKGESTSGMNKICYYRCISGDAAITIKSYKLCPLSISD